MYSTQRHIAERTCVACRQTRPKQELVRLVYTSAGGIVVDSLGKMSGRGVYLCKTRECWHKALSKGRKDLLARSLKIEVTCENRAALSEYGNTLP